MKNYTLLFCLIGLLLFGVTNTNAQTIEVTPNYGYHFGAKLNYYGGYFKLADSGQFGITVGVDTYTDIMAEISYMRQDSELRIQDVVYAPFEKRLADISLDWIQIGATKYFQTDKVRPFFGAALGLVIINPKNQDPSILPVGVGSTTNFAFSFKGGLNYMFSKRVGLNLQGNLLFPVNWGGFYVGGGSGGVSGGVSVSSTSIIGGFSGGLVFVLGDVE